jgi:hypothetical protein
LLKLPGLYWCQVAREHRALPLARSGACGRFVSIARSPWVSENSLHWVLDVIAKEDQRSYRDDNDPRDRGFPSPPRSQPRPPETIEKAHILATLLRHLTTY